jgi:hypothetical protein
MKAYRRDYSDAGVFDLLEDRAWAEYDRVREACERVAGIIDLMGWSPLIRICDSVELQDYMTPPRLKLQFRGDSVEIRRAVHRIMQEHLDHFKVSYNAKTYSSTYQDMGMVADCQWETMVPLGNRYHYNSDLWLELHFISPLRADMTLPNGCQIVQKEFESTHASLSCSLEAGAS